jgi:hypothetical protein
MEKRMASAAADTLIDRWINEPGFKESFLDDPDGTLERAGLTLGEEDWAAVRTIVSGLGDEELTARLSKGGGWWNPN